MPLLPRSTTPFIARRAELAAIGEALARGARLLTLTGPGGTGKTRLSVAVVEGRDDGLFAPLAAARTTGEICAIVARAARLPLTRRVADPAAAVAEELRGRGPTLLVLDNAEHIVEPVAALARRWLDAAPETAIIVTSRWPLGCAGEETRAVGPLALEPAGDGPSDAARLFAAAAPRGVDVAPEHPLVQTTVERLAGNPLAIELAAARLELLTLPRLAERLAERLDGAGALKILRDPARADARHGTLYNLVDWSYALLSAAEQAALRQAAVFVGGFTLEAAEAIFQLPDAEPLDALHGLRRRALLRVDGDGRFWLHALVGEYARARLDADPRRAALEAAHAAHYVAESERRAAEAHDAARPEVIGWLDRERANLMAAHARTITGAPDGAVARRAMAILRALRPLQNGHVPADEQLALIESTRRMVSGVEHAWPDAFAELLRGEARALRYLGRMAESLARLEEALEVARALPERDMEARVLSTMCEVLEVMGQSERALPLAERALVLHRATGELRFQAMTLGHIAQAQCGIGRFAEARATYDEAIALFETLGDVHFLALSITNQATAALEQGDVAFARVRFERALELNTSLGNPRAVAIGESYLALCDQHDGRLRAADARHRRLIATLDGLGAARFACYLRFYLGVSRLEQHDPAEAGAIFEDAAARLRALSDETYRPLAELGAVVAAVRCGRRDAVAEARIRQVMAELQSPHLRPAIALLDAAVALAAGADTRTLRQWSDRALELAAADGDDVRLLARVIAAWVAEARDAAASWICAVDGGWFRAPGGARVELAHRVAPRRIFAALLAAHRVGRVLERAAAIEAGWPGEVMAAASAGNRLRVALSTLRKAGLAELVQRAPGRALRLDSAQRVRIVDG